MNLKSVFVVALLLCCALHGLDAKRKGKSRKGALTKGKSGRPRLRRLSRGSVQSLIDSPDSILLRCQFLERNFGEGAAGIQIRKCKVKRPYKKKVGLTCEFGDYLCARCEMAKCTAYQRNKKVFLYQLAKKVLAGVKQDPRTKELYCSEKPVQFEDDSCNLEFPFSSHFVGYKPKPKTAPRTLAPTTVATTTTTIASHQDCVDDQNQALCNTLYSWGNFIFNQPFQDR